MNAVVGSIEVALHRLVVGDALMVRAGKTVDFELLVALCHSLLLPLHKAADKCHTDKLTILNLTEVCCAWVRVYLAGNLIYAWQWVEDSHTLLSECHTLGVEDKAVLNALILSLVGKALLLYAGHIEDIELAHNSLDALSLGILDAVLIADVCLDIVRQAQLLRRDKDNLNTLISNKCLDKRVDSASILQITAETDGNVIHTTQLAGNCEQVGKGLCRVRVATITGVDNWHRRYCRSSELCTFDVVAHSDNVGKAANNANCILNGLSLAYR